jgi:uncharacterized protein (TIGR01732 family)
MSYYSTNIYKKNITINNYEKNYKVHCSIRMKNIRQVPNPVEEELHNMNYQINGGVIMGHAYGYGKGFALIVVLFILLIIVGAAWAY